MCSIPQLYTLQIESKQLHGKLLLHSITWLGTQVLRAQTRHHSAGARGCGRYHGTRVAQPTAALLVRGQPQHPDHRQGCPSPPMCEPASPAAAAPLAVMKSPFSNHLLHWLTLAVFSPGARRWAACFHMHDLPWSSRWPLESVLTLQRSVQVSSICCSTTTWGDLACPVLQTPAAVPVSTPHSCLRGQTTCLRTREQTLKHAYRLALKSSQKYSTETMDTARVFNVSSVIWCDCKSSSHSIYKFSAIPVKLPMAFFTESEQQQQKAKIC